MKFCKLLLIGALLSIACYAQSEPQVEIVEFALTGSLIDHAAIVHALDNGTIQESKKWTVNIQDNQFSVDDRKVIKAVKEIDSDGTILEWSEHYLGTECSGKIIKGGTDNHFKILGKYDFRKLLAYQLFMAGETKKVSIAQPMFRSMQRQIDVTLEVNKWFIVTSLPQAGVAPKKAGDSITSATHSATIRVMALRITQA